MMRHIYVYTAYIHMALGISQKMLFLS